MQNHIAVVHDQPAAAGFAFHAAFLLVLFAHIVHDCLGQGIQHAVGGAVADDEVVGEGCDVFQIEQ